MSVHMTYPPEAEILHSPEGDVIVWFEIVGPERARQLLKTYRVDYRKERPTHRSTLARDMKNGFWNFDGSPIDRDYQYSRMEYMYLILQAWRAFRANIQIHRLNLPKGEVTREKLVLDYETPQT